MDSQTDTSLASARLHLRSAGYCVGCDRIVELENDGSCPEGHPAQVIVDKIVLGDDDMVPSLPRFNLAAFALPPVWGIAHGQIAGVFFLPIWLFADSAIANAGRNALTAAAAVLVMVGTLAFQAFFAKRASGQAWRRVCDRMSVDEFVARQRTWALFCVPAGIALLAWGLWYRLFLA